MYNKKARITLVTKANKRDDVSDEKRRLLITKETADTVEKWSPLFCGASYLLQRGWTAPADAVCFIFVRGYC